MEQQGLIDELADRTRYTKRELRKILHIMSKIIAEELSGGGNVYIQNIGRLTTQKAGPWKGRNPKTGERVLVPARWRAKLVPCETLREKVAHSTKLFVEEDLLEKYGLKQENNDGKVRSADRSEEGRDGKTRKRYPWL